MNIKLIIGLGNTQKKLLYTRHNVGIWFIIMFINSIHKIQIKFNKIYQYLIHKQNIFFYIPKGYINTCGLYISKIKNILNINPQEILIVYDDINLFPGRIKINNNSNYYCTHNGIKNIIQYFKNEKKFYRLRIGIGKPHDLLPLTKYVLSSPNKKEKIKIYQKIKYSINMLKLYFKHQNFSLLQNLINTKQIN